MSENNSTNPTPPVDRVSALWRRLSEHKIAQWSVAYVAIAYGIQHGVTLTREAFEWPQIVERVTMLLFALGLPLVMTFAWYHGAKASRRVSGGELSIVSLLLVAIAILFYVFARPSAEIGVRGPVSAASIASPESSALTGTLLAVLPFANVSGDPNQEFFSDGMTDEIITALAKIPDLRVVARESAFTFKGKNEDVRAIGKALGARYLVEGSVRKAGDRVRITAQLVRADNGVSLWTEGYDRELKDIFATQEDVARAIAASLQVPLGLKPGDNLVRDRTNDLESYDQYLRAKAVARSGGVGDIGQASKLLEQVVARDPRFAPGWALLAQTYNNLFGTGSTDEERRRIRQQTRDKAEMAAREAIRLDPEYALGYAALGRNQAQRDDRIAAEDLFKQALAHDADDPEVLTDYCGQLAVTGRLKEATNLCMKLRTLDPLIPGYGLEAATIMQLNGQDQAAISVLEAAPVSTVRNLRLARSYAAEGRFAKAADALLLINDPQAMSPKSVEDAAQLLRTAPKKVSARQTLPILDSELRFVYVYIGAPDRVLESLERRRQLFQTGLNASIWLPLYAPLRKTERFKAIVRQAGLVDFWHAKGWPDMCHPVGADDFECN